jgi:hypothetical protein
VVAELGDEIGVLLGEVGNDVIDEFFRRAAHAISW